MNKLIRLFYIALLLSWPVLVSGATSLDAITAQLESRDQIYGQFTQQRTISLLAVPLKSSGQFSFDRDDGLYWTTLQPIKNVIRISEADGVMVGNDVASLTSVSSSDIVGKIFLGLLSVDFREIEVMFDVVHLPDECDTIHGWCLTLRPKSEALKNFIDSVALYGDQYVRTIFLREKNGDVTEINLQVMAEDLSDGLSDD